MSEELSKRVLTAFGEVSMCWSEIPSGVFDSEKASEIAKELITFISSDLISRAELRAKVEGLKRWRELEMNYGLTSDPEGDWVSHFDVLQLIDEMGRE